MTTNEIEFLMGLITEIEEALNPDNAVDSKELTLRNITTSLKDRIADLEEEANTFGQELTQPHA